MTASTTRTDDAPTYVFSTTSAIWRINSRWTGLVYGPAAAILQIAHPAIGHGVARHSDFQNDALGRLRRTLTDVNQIAFGTVTEARATADKLRQTHARVRGTSTSGIHYDAFDQDLMVWVIATLVEASIDGHELVYGPLPVEEKQALLDDFAHFATYFGVRPDPRLEHWATFHGYYRSVVEGDLLGSDPVCGMLARTLVRPADSILSKTLGALSSFLPVETLPPRLLGPLTLRSTPWTRARMRLFRAAFPPLFMALPTPLQCYPRSRRRLAGHG